MSIVTTAYETHPSVMRRQKVERRVVSQLVTDLLNAGFVLAVCQGDNRDDPCAPTTNKKEIMLQLGECDDDRLFVYSADNAPALGASDRVHAVTGWVYLVYGNDGWDVIADYTGNLEKHMALTNALVEKLSDL
ncbi:MAG: hypothetical protein WCP82_10030 [Alphaproteobacteria bacterium]